MTTRLLDAYEDALRSVSGICSQLDETLSTPLEAWSPTAKSLAYVFALLLQNDVTICKSLLTLLSKSREVARSSDDAIRGERGFEDFNALMVAGRQFVDALTTSAYLYYRFDLAAINASLLDSLSSFTSFAPEAFAGVALHSEGLDNLASAYRSVKWNKRSTLGGTRVEHRTFRSRLEWLGEAIFNDRNRDQRVLALFDLASSFAHAGIISTLLASRESSFFSRDGDAVYVESSAAFIEIAFEVADVTLQFYCSTYASGLRVLIKSYCAEPQASELDEKLQRIVEETGTRVEVLARLYKYFTAADVLATEWTLTCGCGSALKLVTGQSEWCTACGSLFEAIILEGGADGVAGSVRPIAVLGRGTIPEGWAEYVGDDTIRVRPTFSSRPSN